MVQLFGGIEAGGTKFVCAAGRGPGELAERVEFPTTTPDETIGRAVEFFGGHAIEALGIACFGPVDLAAGVITSTPKLAWRDTPIVARLRDALGVPVAIDTDVNGAALAELRWGAGRGLDSLLYVTVGTGVGGGAVCGGKLVHGLLHPEMGHIRVPHDWSRDPYKGCCPFHGDCLEGLVCGPAIEGRWGARGETLGDDHAAWDLQAEYLALGMVNWICTLSPRRIVLGGGVMKRPVMYGKIGRRVRELLNGYARAGEIVAPELGGDAGVLGAIALARGDG